MSGTLISLAAIPISAVLWGLFTGRWSAESRRARKLQRDAASVSPVMRVPPPWVFILVYLVGVGLQRILPMGIRSPELAWIIRVAGFVFVVAGIAFAASALGIFRKAKTTTVPFETPSTLVISGPYRFTRNPMYVGLTLTLSRCRRNSQRDLAGNPAALAVGVHQFPGHPSGGGKPPRRFRRRLQGVRYESRTLAVVARALYAPRRRFPGPSHGRSARVACIRRRS